MSDFTERYGISAKPVREALQQLLGEGIIELRMHRGAVVPQVDARYIDDICKLRSALQVMLARESAQRATPTQVQQLQALQEAHEGAAAGHDVGGCASVNRALHHFIDSLADNPSALEVLASLDAQQGVQMLRSQAAQIEALRAQIE